ncbi:hypothetical protein [Flavobacterium soyangense]|uniref:Uncharacterized protein n=1 Tax=Flavobacterium soyangense TaxID=2023265 RepID=A0A930XZV3_9FLAO|nr:hypothetical protein [Flavobacterium soyangense]MBF2709293.1 hypothetical protein [Flavobacterium soyangense]
MKTQLLVFAMITSVFATQMQGQNRTTVQALNSEISDNLDLRVVASIFGDSKNLRDFERRLNDPKLQISNLDLNNDDQVDYLRVIECVENRTHVIIIQSVLDCDLYQDVATIEVEKDWGNNVRIQVVGNTYLYGQNYIYEPEYYYTPLIYASFWISNYRPYYSAWSWNYYPSFYYAWNPFPVFRYRYNVNNCLNNYTYNHYNYVNYRSCNYAANIYNSRRSNGYERQYPEYSFSRRNSQVNNRYELDQIRNTRNVGSRNDVGYSNNRTEYPRANAPQRNDSQRDYSQNRTEYPRANAPQRNDSQRDYSQNRTETPRANTPQRNDSQRDYSQNRTETPRASAPQRNESPKENTQSRNPSSGDNNNSSRGNGNRRS